MVIRAKDFQSGVGDNDDLQILHTERPENYPFNFNWRLRGFKHRNLEVYENKQIEYRLVANGTENYWAGAGDTLLRLRYYPRKQADYSLSATAFLPHTFSYIVKADIEYLSTANYTVTAPYTIHAAGRTLVTQSPFNFRILCDVTCFFAGGSSDVHAVHGTWQTASVTNANYDMATASPLTIATSGHTMTPLVSAYLTTRTGVISHTVSNYRVESNSADYFAYTNRNGSNKVYGLTLRVGTWRVVTDNVIRSETLTAEDASLARVINQTPVATLLAPFITAANIQVYHYYTECPERMANIFVDQNGLLIAHLSGMPTYTRSQVHFDYRIQATVEYRNHLGNILSEIVVSDPLRTATTRNDLNNNLIDARTASQILSATLNRWRVANRVTEIISTNYTIHSYKFVRTMMDYNMQKTYNQNNLYQPLGIEEPFSFCFTNSDGTGNIMGNTNENTQVGVPKLKTIFAPIGITNTDLRLATSVGTAINITENTAAQIMQLHILNDPDVATSVGFIVLAYGVDSHSPGINYSTSTIPNQSTQIRAFRNTEISAGIDYSGLWNFTHDIRAYQINHSQVNTRDFLPTNSSGIPYPLENITYVLTPLNINIDYARTGVSIVWADNGTAGSRLGHSTIRTTTNVFTEHNEIFYVPFTGLLEWRIDILALGASSYPGDSFNCHYGVAKMTSGMHGVTPITSHPGTGVEWMISTSAKVHSNNTEVITHVRTGNRIRLTAEPTPATRPWAHTTPWLTAQVNEHRGYYVYHRDGRQDAVVPLSINIPPGVADGNFTVISEFRSIDAPHIVANFVDSKLPTTNRRADRLTIQYNKMSQGKAEPIDWHGPWRTSSQYVINSGQQMIIQFVSAPASECPIQNPDDVQLEIISSNPMVDVQIQQIPLILNGIDPHTIVVKSINTENAWYPVIKNGYFYFGQSEYHYGMKKLFGHPTIPSEIYVGSDAKARAYTSVKNKKIIVTTINGLQLEPVYGLDNNNQLTLTVTDRICGQNTNKYELSRENVDFPTLIATIMIGNTVKNTYDHTQCILNNNIIELPRNISNQEKLVCSYRVQNSCTVIEEDNAYLIHVHSANVNTGDTINVYGELSEQTTIPINIGTVGQEKNSGFIVLDQQTYPPDKISIKATNNVLMADGLDATSIIVTLTDKFNNPVPNYNVEITSLTLTHPISLLTNDQGTATFMHKSLTYEFVDTIIAIADGTLLDRIAIYMVSPSKLFNVTLICNEPIYLIQGINFWFVPAKLTAYVQIPDTNSLNAKEVLFSTDWGRLNISSDSASHADIHHLTELSIVTNQLGVAECYAGIKTRDIVVEEPWNHNISLPENIPDRKFVVAKATVIHANNIVKSEIPIPIVTLSLYRNEV